MNYSSIGAYAVRLNDPDNPLLADSIETLHKAIAVKWVGRWVPDSKIDPEPVREALLEERWADAVTEWMELTGERLNVYPSVLGIHEAGDYPDDEFGLRIQTTPLFRHDPG